MFDWFDEKKNFLNEIMFMKLKRNDECEFT